MKHFNQHVFDKAPAWARYATRNAWGHLSVWADEPKPSVCGLYFESSGLHRRLSSGFELNRPKVLERLHHV